ncbi:hypothetical protein AYL99_09746 [Fonsecaea erecta]|uniref:Uncharacterized protein n=1 Tax=Fonsecaea erecta TaxID=1367422 RepID=A0A178Z9W8_9EURO|nr:hypothetical protein AYL99_09746 [Fonsecaea erecta]OAP56567.1 hypothetical protein AYL99_09746 [Fonsecaea erecta]
MSHYQNKQHEDSGWGNGSPNFSGNSHNSYDAESYAADCDEDGDYGEDHSQYNSINLDMAITGIEHLVVDGDGDGNGGHDFNETNEDDFNKTNEDDFNETNEDDFNETNEDDFNETNEDDFNETNEDDYKNKSSNHGASYQTRGEKHPHPDIIHVLVMRALAEIE